MRVACKSLCLVLVSSLASVLIGCNLSQFSETSTASSVLPAISGKVHGGQQAISGATIQIYAANTSVSKGASTALIPGVVTTNASGGFSIGAGAYNCPTPGTLVYLVATGGNPGLPGNVNNAAIALMVVLGTCGSLSTDAFVTVNELTTVAAVEALAPFMADAAHVGSDVGNPGGLAGAFGTVASMVNFATGQLQPAASGVTQPVALLNTLADILAACVNTTGTTATGTGCGTLLKYGGSGSATNTLVAMLGIVQAPAANVAQLFGLVGAAVPFAPALPSAPTDLTAQFAFALPGGGLGGSYLLAIDSAQHIWVYPEAGPDGTIYSTSQITVYDTNGSVIFTVPAGAGGLYLPVQLVSDPFGNMWALNSSLTLSKFGPNGGPLSPSVGFPIPLMPPASLYGSSTYFGGKYISIDPSGNLWAVNSGTSSNCFVEVNNSGTVITPKGNFCGAAGNSETALVAADGSGNAWLGGFQTVSKVSSSGALVASGVTSNGCFDIYDGVPSGGTGPALLASAYINEGLTSNLIYDRVNDRLWGTTFVGAGALRSDGSQALCYSRGLNLPVIPTYYIGDDQTYTTGFLWIIDHPVLDGAGNLWFATFGQLITRSNPPGSPYPNVTQNFIGGLNAITSGGSLITPYSAAGGIYGLQPSYGTEFTGTMGIDGYGNIWMIVGSTLSASPVPSLIKISGLAAPKNYQ